MPDFIYKHKVYYHPVEFALHFIGGTWKMPILWRLHKATLRYGELKKTLPHISDKVISTQLKQLEANGYIDRKVYAEVPPHTEYSLTEKGRQVIPLITHIRDYGLQMMQELGIAENE